MLKLFSGNITIKFLINMKKIITIIGALNVASTPTIALKNIAPHQTLNLQNILKSPNSGIDNLICNVVATDHKLNFSVDLNISDYNGFSGFLDQISFNLSDDNWHAWPLYFFQWIDDDDFHSGPMPALNSHTKHGFFHDPMIWGHRLETYMGHFGLWTDDKSDVAYYMATSWGSWGDFAQNAENTYNKAVVAHTALGITFNFGFTYNSDTEDITTIPPSFNIVPVQ